MVRIHIVEFDNCMKQEKHQFLRDNIFSDIACVQTIPNFISDFQNNPFTESYLHPIRHEEKNLG